MALRGPGCARAALLLAVMGAAGMGAAGGSMAVGAAASPDVVALANGPAGAAMAGWDGAGYAQDAGAAVQGGQVVRVAVSADARETGAAFVSMNYRLAVTDAVEAVPFTLLLFAPASVGEISAQVGGDPLAVRITQGSAPRLEGEIELPAALAGTEQLSLDVGYRVADAVRADGDGVRVVLPMLAVDWAPAEASPGMFQAEVTLPEGMEAREIFPVTAGGGAAPGVARASLQVLPAVVQVRARPEGSFGLSLPGVLELFVLVVVVACGMMGLRYVRRLR